MALLLVRALVVLLPFLPSSPPAGLPAPLASRPALRTASPAWVVPLQPGVVRRGFRPPPEPWASGHRGVDLAGRPLQPVRSAGTGRVAFAGTVAGRGVVVVVHGTLRTTYEPVTASVRAGDAVGAGAVLGRLAAAPSHCAPEACLHWGLLCGAQYLDPLLLLGVRRGPSRLLPVWPTRGG